MKDNLLEIKIGNTNYVVEVKNAEKSRASANDMFKKMVTDVIDGTENFVRSY